MKLLCANLPGYVMMVSWSLKSAEIPHNGWCHLLFQQKKQHREKEREGERQIETQRNRDRIREIGSW